MTKIYAVADIYKKNVWNLEKKVNKRGRMKRKEKIRARYLDRTITFN